MSAVTGRILWTVADDDRSAFEEAMDVADVALRRLQSAHHDLRRAIRALEHVSEAERAGLVAQLDRIESLLETPPVTRWRQQHSEGRGRKRSQQHVLECKLAVARRLFAELGVDLDAIRVPHQRG